MAGAWDVIAGALGFGGPSGNDHGSSNWVAWGHDEICTMLQNTVEPADIHEAADAWRQQGRRAEDLVTGLTADLRGIVTGGWRGASADKAISVLDPIKQWSAAQAETTDHTTRLMDASGAATSQTKMAMPEPVSHSWTESLAVTALTGPAGGIVDAVVQERRQSEAQAEAVRVMTSVYSAPLNDYRTGVPAFAQLANPTVAQPDPAAVGGPVPGAGHVGHVGGGAGHVVAGAGGLGGGGTVPGGAHPHVSAAPPAAAELQGVSDPGAGLSPAGGGPILPDQPARRGQHTGGQVAAAAAAAAAGVPLAAPAAASVARRLRAGGGALPLGSGRIAGAHGGGTGHLGEFGPRPTIAPEATEGRLGSALGHGTPVAGAGRGGVSAMPMAPMGAGRGKDGEDSEHRRPSYLIEMDDVFTDGRKVAPAVIGEDAPGPGT